MIYFASILLACLSEGYIVLFASFLNWAKLNITTFTNFLQVHFTFIADFAEVKTSTVSKVKIIKIFEIFEKKTRNDPVIPYLILVDLDSPDHLAHEFLGTFFVLAHIFY